MQRHVIAVSAALFLTAFSAPAQTNQSGYFVGMLGRDTIAVEEWSSDAHSLRGSSVARAPKTSYREYSAEFTSNGALAHLHITYQQPGGPVYSERDYAYSDDSVHVTFRQDTMTNRYAVAATDRPVPFFADIFAGWQLAVLHAVKTDIKKGFGVLTGKKVMHYDIEGSAPGSLHLKNPNNDFGPMTAVVGKDGLLDKYDMTETTDKFVAMRVPTADVKGTAKNYAEREKAGNAVGPLSPRDTARATVNGASIMVDYGRPSVRGRVIFGQVVPWNTVWRTGANAATQLMTSKDLMFGTTLVPAGTYSVFTLPSQEGWKLIINSQHGQWGTVYDQTKDVVRLPLDVKKLDDLVEKFTFDIASDGSRGTLRFRWEKTEASVPFTVK